MNFEFKLEKKQIIKIVIGILVFLIAFCAFMFKNYFSEDELVTSGKEKDEMLIEEDVSELTTQDAINHVIAEIIVDVGGAVKNKGVVILKEGSRVYEAIDGAGGTLESADTSMINLAAVLTDGDKLYIPAKGEFKDTEAPAISQGNTNITVKKSPGITSANNNSNNISGGSSAETSSTSNNTSSLININTASSVELQKLSGVGPATAEKIINYREQNGKFSIIDDIKKVSGIGEKTFDKFKSQIAVN